MISRIFESYSRYHYKPFTSRFIKHSELLEFYSEFKQIDNELAGFSAEGRSIHLLSAGTGPVKVFLWSQMHGDEPTATMALADLFSFLVADDEFNEFRLELLNNLSLYFIPMVNPDGAEYYTRRNRQQIDINRDFMAQQSPEGKILRHVFEKIKPDFSFNLHDMSIQWSAGLTGNPAAVALLAPGYDEQMSVNPIRERAMKTIAGMHTILKNYIPDFIGRWVDDYEPRAFGDNCQKNGSSTILIETGGYKDDWDKQFVRKKCFLAILSGLDQISSEKYKDNTLDDYFSIPENKKNHYSMVIRNCSMHLSSTSYKVDIGLLATQKLNADGRSATSVYTIEEIGDMSQRWGYEEVDACNCQLIATEPLGLENIADFILMNGSERILSFEKGHLSRT